MPTVLLIRHGENDYSQKQKLAGRLPGIHLNKKGEQQAKDLALALKDLPLKAVYSSPLERAMETALPIAEAHNLKVVRRPGLIETDQPGWQGKSIRQLIRSKEWRVLQTMPSRFRFPDGESIAEQQMRQVAELETLCAQHKEQDYFACIGHADPFKSLIAYYIGLPLDYFQRLTLNTASVSMLALGKRAKLLRLNWTTNNLKEKGL
ncbi:MAG: histidine phosphatase family protein [Anaerolineales bacterium]